MLGNSEDMGRVGSGTVQSFVSDSQPISTHSSEDVRQALREKAISSTYFMAKAVIGFKDITPHTHGVMCKFIDGPERIKLGLAPRDHLKTSVWTIANTMVRICRNPNIRILLGNETSTNASHFLRRVQAIFERNGVFRWLFPEIIPDFNARGTKWSETEMCVVRSDDFPESTVEAIGVGGAVVGRHYDLIKMDDLVGKEASESEEVMRKTIDWYIYAESLLNDPTHSEIQNYGTRWGYHDLHSWAFANEEGASLFFRSCYNEDGTPWWPERFTDEALNRIRRKLGSFKFSCQYLNDPKDPDTNSFDRKWLRFYELGGYMCNPRVGSAVDWRTMRRSMRIDPAISEDDKACETAIIIDGVDTLNRKFILATWSGHCQPSEMFEKMFELAEAWEIEDIGIESVAFSKHLKYFFDQECSRQGISFVVVELKTNKRSKPARIRAMQPYCERGEIFVQEQEEEFLKQYDEFPTGRLVDLLDAWAYGPQMWELPNLQLEDETEETRAWHRSEMWEGRNEITGY